jgi:hypothetical protein
MLLVATLAAAAGAAAISPVQAAETPQLTDVAYLQAAHCAGLAEGAKHDTRHVRRPSAHRGKQSLGLGL